MQSIKDLDFQGKRVLIRVDFNVPLTDDHKVADDSRIEAHLPTIKTVMENNGKVVLMSHLGRPKGKYNADLSLSVVAEYLRDRKNLNVRFSPDCVGREAENATRELRNNEILLLENLRFHSEETEGDRNFATQLAANGDFYINDAFGAAHREHASTAVIAELFGENKAFGLVMEKEILNIDKALYSDAKPTLAIIGGAKVSSKIGVIKNLLPKVDQLVIGGGMSHTFIKASGGEVGNSLLEKDYLNTAREVMKMASEKGVEIILPTDSLNADKFANDANTNSSDSREIPEGWMGLDIGPETLKSVQNVIASAQVIIWNGPMGVFELEKFAKGTQEVAKAIASATDNGAFSLIGGGDSVAAIKKFGLEERVSYVSTGGGAMLEYLEGQVLPGIKAMKS